MDLPPGSPEGFFPFPEGGRMGFEFSIDLGGRPLDIGECTEVLARIRTCRAYIVATASFGRWLADEASLSGQAAASAKDLARALEGKSRPRQVTELGELARSLGLFNPLTRNYPHGLQFEFVGAFLENPTVFRFIARGATYSLIMAVSILGLVQAQKQWGASQCREQANGMARAQLDMLEKLARIEGGWTPRHAASHKEILKAVEVASATCGADLNGIGVRVRAPSGAELEVRLGSTPRATPGDGAPSPKG